MNCPDCGGEMVVFAVPTDYHEFVPGDESTAALCTHCLALHPAPEGDADSNPDFTAVSDAFPSGEAGTAMALAVGLLDSLALHRTEIETLLERVEQAGVDPLLVLDRLAADPELDPQTNLATRRRQVEQFRN
jgi:membrane-associated phospholipid phosphatase